MLYYGVTAPPPDWRAQVRLLCVGVNGQRAHAANVTTRQTRQKPARPAPLCVSIMDEGVEKSARYDLNSRQLLETGVQGLCVKI